jgi:integrase
MLHFTQFKNRNRKPKEMWIPIIDELRTIIDATPSGHLTYLVTEYGKPFTGNGFGNRFRKWCDDAGLKHCSAHGLRKAAGARLAELGCSAHEIASMLGHDTLKEVVRYTKAAKQKMLAQAAGRRMAHGYTENESFPLSEQMQPGGKNTAAK